MAIFLSAVYLGVILTSIFAGYLAEAGEGGWRWAFVFGSAAPAVLGWMSERFSLRTGFLSLSVFFFSGAVVLIPAMVRYFRQDYIKQDG